MQDDTVLIQIYQLEEAMKANQKRILEIGGSKAWDGYTYLLQHWQDIDDRLITNHVTQHVPRDSKRWARFLAWKIPQHMRELRRLERQP